jgi:hypothetical protein
MLRWIILTVAMVTIPVVVWMGISYSQLKECTFEQAVFHSTTSSEGEQAPKVLVRALIVQLRDQTGRMLCQDDAQREFPVEFTGSQESVVMTPNSRVQFVGHVHDGTPPYFHATQVLAERQ